VTLWLSELDVLELMDMGNAISALKQGLLLEAHGQALNMTKTHISWGQGSTLHAIGAVFPTRDLREPRLGLTHPKEQNPSSTFRQQYWVIAGGDGGVRTRQLRTGAISGIATELLSARRQTNSQSSARASKR